MQGAQQGPADRHEAGLGTAMAPTRQDGPMRALAEIVVLLVVAGLAAYLLVHAVRGSGGEPEGPQDAVEDDPER